MKRLLYLITSLAVTAAMLAATASSRPGVSVKVSWHKVCPAGLGVCADFPYVSGEGNFKLYQDDCATSSTGKCPTYTAWIWRNTATHAVCKAIDYSTSCMDSDFYTMSVFHSKFTDPITALTSLNGGIKSPIQTTVQGNVAVKWSTGIYHAPGLAVYHNGAVYLLQVGGVGGKAGFYRPGFGAQFIASIKFNS